jgi:hypothetical protein
LILKISQRSSQIDKSYFIDKLSQKPASLLVSGILNPLLASGKKMFLSLLCFTGFYRPPEKPAGDCRAAFPTVLDRREIIRLV